MTDSLLSGLVCTRCGAAPGGEPAGLGCAKCHSGGVAAALSTAYDLDAARASFRPEILRERPFGPSRFSELMPQGTGMFRLTEGGTPLLAADALAERLGVRTLLVKDESRNPTWSFKDRAAAVAAARAVQQNSTGLVVASTGNAAAATSAYAAAAGLPVVVLFARGVDPIMAGFVTSFGGAVVATETKSDRWVFMRRCVDEYGFYPNSNYADPPVGNDPYALDGYKAIAFELWDQLGFQMPDAIVTPVGYGDSLFGIYKASHELKSLGLARMPRLIAGERYGSLRRTIEGAGDVLVKVTSDGPTIASSIATVQSTYQALHAITASGGAVYQVSDADVLKAQGMLIETEGIFAEAASAAGIAALVKERDAGLLDPSGTYVFINTSAGIKSVAATGKLDSLPEVVTDENGFDSFMSDVLTADAGGGTA